MGIAAAVEERRLRPREMRLVQPVDQHALVVRLAAIDAQAERDRLVGEPRVNVVQRVMAVYLRLARAGQVEIGARQDEDDGKLGQRPGFRLRGWATSTDGVDGKRERMAKGGGSLILTIRE